MQIAIVIPTYNEKENIKNITQAIFKQVPKADIFIVDDNSPDGTGKLVKTLSKKNPKIHLISRPLKEGIGRAYINGFTEVLKKKPKVVIQMDADFSHDPAILPHMLMALKDYDLVIGSRYINGISVINWPLRRVLLSYFANIYVRFFTGLRVKDCTSGFKCYKAEVLDYLNLQNVKSDGYCYQIEMTYILKKLGFAIKEIPIIFIDRHSGTSKMSYRIILEAFIRVLFIPFKNKNKYKKNVD